MTPSDPDWSAALLNPEDVRAVLGTPPPPLTDYALTTVHLDEREASATLRFFAFGVPAGAAAAWEEAGHNAVTFSLLCTGVRNLVVDGWSTDPLTGIALTADSVELSGSGKRMTFDAATITATAPTGSRAGGF
ncbi:immunity 50 family protein [Kitasatospora sp. NBC_00085]|uniref:Imm50 family immunity protein n=1 Tax=unclassified Kitasatospora TaxID=2633591 RepID=UPI003250C04D